MVNIKFPNTDVVSCVFSLKNSTNVSRTQDFDDFGIIPEGSNSKLKQYYYRVPTFLQGKLAPGDFVVVYCQTGYQVCQVYKINEFAPVETAKLAPVVARVDLMEYFNDLAHQEELKKMKAALVEERKRLEEQVTWDLIAAKSPEFAAMLDAFRKAGGEL